MARAVGAAAPVRLTHVRSRQSKPAGRDRVETRPGRVHRGRLASPQTAWRIGTEHEKFAYRLSDLRPLPYEGTPGIRAVLEGLERFGWQPVFEGDTVIALTFNGQSVTLEPGGQIELSGAPRANLHETCAEVHRHLEQVKEVGAEMGAGFLGVGFQPKWPLADVPTMPKGRYAIMKRYMPTKGGLGLDMMHRTCTVQVNLDFSSEADMVRKFRVGLALQPVATALFANSPFTEGAPIGFLSYRSHVWTDTDPRTARAFFRSCSTPPWASSAMSIMSSTFPCISSTAPGPTSTPRASRSAISSTAGCRRWPGEKPTMKDWEDHLTTLFPEVRMKQFLEYRGADGGRWDWLCALPALWTGLLYDGAALDAAWDEGQGFHRRRSCLPAGRGAAPRP